MSDYTKTFKIIPEQVSPFKELRPSSILRILQEMSIEQTESFGYPKDVTDKKGVIWVVAKQHVEIKRMPVYGETLTVSTYTHKTMHVLFPRTYEFKDEKGELIILASSIWSLIDINKRKMANPSDYGIEIPDLSNGRKFNMPFSLAIPFDLENEQQIKAEYSFCDFNGHINNTSYLDIAENLMPIEYLKNNRLKEFEIKYMHEVPLGTSMPVKFGVRDNTYYFVNEAFQLWMKY